MTNKLVYLKYKKLN